MKARVVRMYCERLEEIIEGMIIECETLIESDGLSDYQQDKLEDLNQSARDLRTLASFLKIKTKRPYSVVRVKNTNKK